MLPHFPGFDSKLHCLGIYAIPFVQRSSPVKLFGFPIYASIADVPSTISKLGLQEKKGAQVMPFVVKVLTLI